MLLLIFFLLFKGAYTFLVITSKPTTTFVPTKLSLLLQNTTAGCEDTITDCGHYGHHTCTDDVYRAWARAHCPRYCGLCTPTVVNSNECNDKLLNCNEYDSGDLCTNPAYSSWSYDNCRGYCKLGICSGIYCKDVYNDCNRLDITMGICSNVDQARNVCQKFCGLCNVKDGKWSEWTSWGSCDVTCGSGTQVRRRTCTDPAPTLHGHNCTGISEDTKTCGGRCPVDGGWNSWNAWNACSVTCGVGLQNRVRECTNPPPDTEGQDCQGEKTDYNVCYQRACSDGGWSHWARWSNCSVECGGGIRTRERSCTSPAPSRFGLQCQGNSKDIDQCSINPCQGYPQNNALQALQTYANSNVAFTVKNLSAGKFSTVLYNIGDGYSISTGKFTAPLPGIYQFIISLTKKRTDADLMYCYIQLNGVDKIYIHVDPHDDDNSDFGSYSATASAVFHLNRTDYLNLGGCSTWSTFESNACTFTGILVRPDIKV